MTVGPPRSLAGRVAQYTLWRPPPRQVMAPRRYSRGDLTQCTVSIPAVSVTSWAAGARGSPRTRPDTRATSGGGAGVGAVGVSILVAWWVEWQLDLLPGVAAGGEFQIPAGIDASGAPPQGDVVGGQAKIGG